jgi:hypothetical protein
MGVEKKSITFRLSEQTLIKLDAIRGAFDPFAEDRSSTLRIVISIMYALLFTPAILVDFRALLQRLHRNTLQDNVVQLRLPLSGRNEPAVFETEHAR